MIKARKLVTEVLRNVFRINQKTSTDPIFALLFIMYNLGLAREFSVKSAFTEGKENWQGLEKCRKRTRAREKKSLPLSTSEMEAVSEGQPRQKDLRRWQGVSQGQKVYQSSTVQKHSPKAEDKITFAKGGLFLQGSKECGLFFISPQVIWEEDPI